MNWSMYTLNPLHYMHCCMNPLHYTITVHHYTMTYVTSHRITHCAKMIQHVLIVCTLILWGTHRWTSHLGDSVAIRMIMVVDL